MALALFASGGWASSAVAQKSPHSDLKAAVLYNFVHFVEWPASAFASDHAPLVIGIFGDDPFGPNLDALVAREKVGNHQLVVERHQDVPADFRCHILFVSTEARERTAELLARLKDKPVLTVADHAGFIRSGGMIVMHEKVGERILIRVNLKAVQASGLILSAKLLRVAEIISPEED